MNGLLEKESFTDRIYIINYKSVTKFDTYNQINKSDYATAYFVE